jgi:hypothetical protein
MQELLAAVFEQIHQRIQRQVILIFQVILLLSEMLLLAVIHILKVTLQLAKIAISMLDVLSN